MAAKSSYSFLFFGNLIIEFIFRKKKNRHQKPVIRIRSYSIISFYIYVISRKEFRWHFWTISRYNQFWFFANETLREAEKKAKEEEKSNNNVYKYLHWNFCVTECRSFLTYVLARVSFSLLFFSCVVCVVTIREQKRAFKRAWLARSLIQSTTEVIKCLI